MTRLTSVLRPCLSLATVFTFVLFVGFGSQLVLAQTADKEAAEKYNEGLALLKEKNYETALGTFLETKEIADAAGDKGTASKAENYAYRLCYNVGVGYQREGDLDKAMSLFDQGIAMEPTYYKNFKGRARVLQDQENEAAAMEAWIKTSEVATAAGELEERSKARAQAEGFVARAMKAENYSKVIENGTTFLKYSETSMVHFYLAYANNQLGKYPTALEHADKALALDQGSRSSRAKIHFERGEAYKRSGRLSEARDAYSEAAYGEFKQRAEHEIEEITGSN